LLMLPTTAKRFFRLPGEPARYVAIETLINRFTDVIFPGFEKLGKTSFRVIRDSDIEVEEEAEDLVLFFKTAIKRRRRGRVIRLEPNPDMPAGAGRSRPRGIWRDRSGDRRYAGISGCRRSGRIGRGGAPRPEVASVHAALSRARTRAWRRHASPRSAPRI
jgi:hypothetical protein